MFTGLVEAVGRLVGREARGEGVSLRIRAPELARDLHEGESVAVDGVCQTVTRRDGETLTVVAVRTTLARTTLDDFAPGRPVNLERSLRADSRLGGHFVQGHVDGVGTVAEVQRAGETVFVRVELTAEVARLTVPLGSLAVDGVSLTVNRLEGRVAELAIIPYTWSHTALSRLVEGDRVNLEADLIAKYVSKLVEPYAGARGEGTGGTKARPPFRARERGRSAGREPGPE